MLTAAAEQCVFSMLLLSRCSETDRQYSRRRKANEKAVLCVISDVSLSYCVIQVVCCVWSNLLLQKCNYRNTLIPYFYF